MTKMQKNAKKQKMQKREKILHKSQFFYKIGKKTEIEILQLCHNF